jgi:hypothetical protein
MTRRPSVLEACFFYEALGFELVDHPRDERPADVQVVRDLFDADIPICPDMGDGDQHAVIYAGEVDVARMPVANSFVPRQKAE